MSDSVIAINSSSKVLFYNKAAVKLFGFKSSIVNSKLSSSLQFYDNGNQPVSLLDRVDMMKSITKIEDLHFNTSHGERLDLSIDISKIKSDTEEYKNDYIVIFRDITKERSLDKERDEFIAITSDELRNPIAVIEGALSMATNRGFIGEVQPQIALVLKKAYEEVGLLAEIAMKLGRLSEVEIGDFQLVHEDVDVNKLLDQLYEKFNPLAKKKNIKLKMRIQSVESIYTVRIIISEILTNYLDNAIKHTNKGHVEIKVSKNKNSSSVIFTVIDTGSGIGTSDKQRIFSKYYRSEDYLTEQTKGMGLGLYIVRKLSDSIGGKVWFDSVI